MKRIKMILTLVVLIIVSHAFGQVVEPVGKDRVANGGYDFVSYFTDNKPLPGKKEFTYETNKVKYQFASKEHMNMFIANPDHYLPVCDGYCAWGVAEKGKRVPVDPQTFKIIDGKLYLFFNGNFNGGLFNTLPEWNKNEATLLNQLPEQWAKLNKK